MGKKMQKMRKGKAIPRITGKRQCVEMFGELRQI
jgi:hypothetical protein